jgi:hypothetical protein
VKFENALQLSQHEKKQGKAGSGGQGPRFRRIRPQTHPAGALSLSLDIPGILRFPPRYMGIGLLKDVKVKSYCYHSGLSGIFLRKDSRQAGVTDCGIRHGTLVMQEAIMQY